MTTSEFIKTAQKALGTVETISQGTNVKDKVAVDEERVKQGLQKSSEGVVNQICHKHLKERVEAAVKETGSLEAAYKKVAGDVATEASKKMLPSLQKLNLSETDAADSIAAAVQKRLEVHAKSQKHTIDKLGEIVRIAAHDTLIPPPAPQPAPAPQPEPQKQEPAPAPQPAPPAQAAPAPAPEPAKTPEKPAVATAQQIADLYAVVKDTIWGKFQGEVKGKGPLKQETYDKGLTLDQKTQLEELAGFKKQLDKSPGSIQKTDAEIETLMGNIAALLVRRNELMTQQGTPDATPVLSLDEIKKRVKKDTAVASAPAASPAPAATPAQPEAQPTATPAPAPSK